MQKSPESPMHTLHRIDELSHSGRAERPVHVRFKGQKPDCKGSAGGFARWTHSHNGPAVRAASFLPPRRRMCQPVPIRGCFPRSVLLASVRQQRVETELVENVCFRHGMPLLFLLGCASLSFPKIGKRGAHTPRWEPLQQSGRTSVKACNAGGGAAAAPLARHGPGVDVQGAWPRWAGPKRPKRKAYELECGSFHFHARRIEAGWLKPALSGVRFTRARFGIRGRA